MGEQSLHLTAINHSMFLPVIIMGTIIPRRFFSLLGMDNVWYVLANCIRLSAKRKAALGIEETHVLRVSAGRTFPLEELRITTFRSTDAGVAFLVETEGKTFIPRRGFAMVALGRGTETLE